MKTLTFATTALLLSTALLALAPSASAHACAFDYSDSCSKEPCGPSGTHVHWGNRLVPCVGSDLLGVTRDIISTGSDSAYTAESLEFLGPLDL